MPKPIHIVTLILAFIAIASLRVSAQQQKVGYVDTDFILSKIPDYKNIDQELKTITGQWRSRLDEMQQQIESLKNDFSSKEILYTDKIRKQKETEIEQLVQKREQYLDQKFGSNGEYFKKQQELLQPIQQEVFTAISVIAKRDGYDFVFDRSQNAGLLFSEQQWNLNTEVLIELGISVDDLSN